MLAGAMGLPDPTEGDILEAAYTIASGAAAVPAGPGPGLCPRHVCATMSVLQGVHSSWQALQAMPGQRSASKASLCVPPAVSWLQRTAASASATTISCLQLTIQTWYAGANDMYNVPARPPGEEDLPIVPMAEFMREAKELHTGLTSDCKALQEAVRVRCACQVHQSALVAHGILLQLL